MKSHNNLFTATVLNHITFAKNVKFFRAVFENRVVSCLSGSWVSDPTINRLGYPNFVVPVRVPEMLHYKKELKDYLI